ncbi:hypothetical protein B7463_g7907, partial [Scytalidium lignicola]
MTYTNSNVILKGILTELTHVEQALALDDVIVLLLIAFCSAGYFSKGGVWNKPNPYNHLWYERPQGIVTTASRTSTRNISTKMSDAHKSVVIFWGSQSGTAEGFAIRLAQECYSRFGLSAMAADLSDYDPSSIGYLSEKQFAVFILSTYGEGDPSDNTGGLWNWLHQSPEISLGNLRYMAFGLGNSSYRFYNRVVDVVVETFNKHGAIALLPVGRADDSKGETEEDFMAWKEKALECFREKLNLQDQEFKYEPKYTIEDMLPSTETAVQSGEPIWRPEYLKVADTYSPVRALPIKISKDLLSTPQRNCLHIELNLAQYPDLKYKTGDHLAIWPINPDTEVSRLLGVLGLEHRKERVIRIAPTDASQKTKLPSLTTIEALFRYYLDICAPVSRETILALCHFAPSTSELEFLSQLGKSKAKYSQLQKTMHITLGRLLQLSTQNSPTTKWSALPISFVLETLPSMMPRYYSVSSSSIVSPRQPSITVMVSTTKLSINTTKASDNLPGESIFGLATNYLLALTRPHPHGLTYRLDGPNNILEGGKIHAMIRRSKFKLPASPSSPLIMIAAGTGLAPFRAFIQERARLKIIGKDIGQMKLFFGCRRDDEDFIYKDELMQIQEELGEETLQIITAFSRDKAEEKVYVQDRIRENEKMVCDMLMEMEATLYICGSAAMGRDVAAIVGNVVKERRQWNDKELKDWVEQRSLKGAFLIDSGPGQDHFQAEIEYEQQHPDSEETESQSEDEEEYDPERISEAREHPLDWHGYARHALVFCRYS